MRRAIIYIMYCLLVVLASCTEDITLKLSSAESRLVVDGHICDVPSPYNYVRLTMSSDYFSNGQPLAVTGAHVVISDGLEETILTEDSERKGFYMAPSAFAGKHDVNYTLTVSGVDTDHDGRLETYTASSPMPPTYIVDSVNCTYHEKIDHYLLGMYAAEDTTMSNFYMFGMAYNDSLVTDSYTKFTRTNDSWFVNSYCWGATVVYFDDDDIVGEICAGDTVSMYALSINEDFYDYLDAIDDIIDGANPMFSSAPANAVGNVSNGALGFFTAFAVVRVDCLVKK